MRITNKKNINREFSTTFFKDEFKRENLEIWKHGIYFQNEITIAKLPSNRILFT